MGRTRSQKKTGPAYVQNGTRNQGSVKRSASCLIAAQEISNVKRKVMRTMPPVKSPNGDGGEPLNAVTGKASAAAAAAAAGSPRHFRFTDIMEKKLNGGTWTEDEIKWFISEIVKTDGTIEASQIGAFLMCTFIKGLNAEETACLTKAMMLSGDTLSWPKEWEGTLVDKHSTGGVGDKVSLILAPALAACGMKVPMISGRGLGHTGGTLDKLESIPGYTVHLQSERMRKIMEDVGCCICGQTANLVPADKILYGIRDVTSTVSSLPLITGSIISKKAAESVNALVLDVKVGKSAIFSQDETLGREMATSLVSQECRMGGDNRERKRERERMGGCLIDSLLQGTCNGKQQISDTLDNGTALAKFQDMIIAQGVDGCLAKRLCGLPMDNIDEVWQVLKKAENKTQLKAEKTGYISSINSLELAKVCLELGAGRAVATAAVDHSVGVNLLAHVGSHVKKGESWVTVYHQASDFTEKLSNRLQATLEYSDHPVSVPNIVIDVVRPS
eukprot:XP_011671394.1 PREDICTED: thymidine phosphorylase [Strongylocentrotus purpuratus]